MILKKMQRKAILMPGVYFILNAVFSFIENVRWNAYYSRVTKNLCSIGHDVFVDRGVQFRGSQRISIGNNVFIGSNVILNAGKGGNIKIGDMTAIASNTTIITRNIDNLNNLTIDRSLNKSIFKDVVIGSGVGIGYNVTINPGVVLGDGCEVAAGSVVTKNVKPYAIMAGAPAVLVGMRRDFNNI